MMLTWRRSSLAAAAPIRRLRAAGRLFGAQVEPVAMCDQRYGYGPWRFRHRGDLHRVCRVEGVRVEAARWGRAARRYFTVRCADGAYHTLFQDLRAGTWHIEP
jgi:hypothetical protein